MTLLGALFVGRPIEAQTSPEPPVPAAPTGYKSTIIRLPNVAAESDLRIEIIVGKLVDADCNRRTLTGILVRKEALNGAVVHVLEKVSGTSTMMGCMQMSISSGPDGKLTTAPAKTTKQFLEVAGGGFFLDYSSRAPTLIQVPIEYSVKYRLFTAGKIEDAAEVR